MPECKSKYFFIEKHLQPPQKRKKVEVNSVLSVIIDSFISYGTYSLSGFTNR